MKKDIKLFPTIILKITQLKLCFRNLGLLPFLSLINVMLKFLVNVNKFHIQLNIFISTINTPLAPSTHIIRQSHLVAWTPPGGHVSCKQAEGSDTCGQRCRVLPGAKPILESHTRAVNHCTQNTVFSSSLNHLSMVGRGALQIHSPWPLSFCSGWGMCQQIPLCCLPGPLKTPR